MLNFISFGTRHIITRKDVLWISMIYPTDWPTLLLKSQTWALMSIYSVLCHERVFSDFDHFWAGKGIPHNKHNYNYVYRFPSVLNAHYRIFSQCLNSRFGQSVHFCVKVINLCLLHWICYRFSKLFHYIFTTNVKKGIWIIYTTPSRCQYIDIINLKKIYIDYNDIKYSKMHFF